MELRVLGPLAVHDGPRVVDVGGWRQRRLLCALLLDTDEVVGIDTLVERVWDDDDRPAEAVRALRTYLSRLRTSLPQGDRLIETGPSGYVLRLDGHVLDARRVDELVGQMRRSAAADAQQAAISAEAALSLWRGRSFDDVADLPWAVPEVQRLEELRRCIEEDRFDALLACGRASDAVVDLQRAVAAEPLRERRQGQLMVALHRSGRQAEALRAFERYRAQLATETGLLPSEALRELEAQILAGHVPGGTAIGAAADAPRRLRSYELGRQLGEGAFALVWQATQPSVGREVAIKQIRAEFANRPEFVRRFETEAHLVARLEHRHIVPLYDYWREPDSAYLVMRWLRGGTLQQRIDRDGALPIADCALLASELGGALAAAHRAGVVHRDVKPGNVFCDEDGHFYLGDFGIAIDTAQAVDRESSLSAGSPAYASPEQLRREPVGPAADIHALGVTLYEALTGEIPFPNEPNQAALLQRQLHDPIPSVRAMRTDVPPALDEVIARATAKDPTARYASVADLLDAFTLALRPDGAVARVARRASTMVDLGLANPYKGLRAFTEADAGEFFGRDRLVAELVDRLRRPGTEGRMLTIVGPSGCGKSSVVRAGLVPALRHGAVAGSDGWFIVSMVPSRHPFEELEAALLRIAVNPPDRLLHQLADGPRGIARSLKRVLTDDPSYELVLVIDQFEELFTLCEDAGERRRFLRGLAEAVRDQQTRLRLVITVRADFYDRPLAEAEIAALVKGSTVSVTPLAADELERAITEPAERVGAEFEPGLVAQIVVDAADQPGALPLLQYALTELYERRVSGMFTKAAYDELGGLSGALARRADELTEELIDAYQLAVRKVFERLVTLGDGVEDTRRRVVRRELGSDESTGNVIERFGAARLLSFDRDPTSREPTVEVAHEALIRRWPRLREWLAEDRDALRIHRQVTDAALSWHRGGRDDGELYRGARLELASDWLLAHDGDPNALEREFLDASRAAADATRLRELRARRRLRRAFVAVAAIAAVALLAGVLALQQRSSARSAAAAARTAAGDAATQRDTASAVAFAAETGRLAALAPTLTDTDLSLSFLLAAEAAQRSTTTETLGALQRVLVAADNNLGFIPTGAPLRDVFYDGPDRLVGFTDSELIVWNATTHERVRVLALGGPLLDGGSLTLSRASFAAGRAAWVDVSSVAHTVRIDREDAPRTIGSGAAAVAVHPDGRRIAVAGVGGDLRLVDADSGGEVWATPGDPSITFDDQTAVDLSYYPPLGNVVIRDLAVAAVAFAPDGRRLVHAHGVLLHDIDVATGRLVHSVDTVHPIGVHTFSSARVTFTADGARVLASANLAVSSYDAATMELRSRFNPTRRPQVFPAAVVALDGERVAVLDFGGELTIVREADGAVVDGPVTTRVGSGNALAVSPDGRRMVVAGRQGAVVLALDGGGPFRIGVPRRPGDAVLNAAPDGSWLAVQGRAGISLPESKWWDCAAGSPCRPVEPSPVASDTFVLPDAGSGYGTLYLSNGDQPDAIQVVDSRTRMPVSPMIPSGGLTFTSIVVDPHGHWVAFDNSLPTPGNPQAVRIHSIATGALIAQYDVTEKMLLATPPSGRLILAAGKQSGTAFVIDTTTWEREPFGLPDGEVTVSAFSPDGRYVITADLAGDLMLRDGETFAAIRTLQADAGVANSFAGLPISFSDDGRYVVSAHDGRGRLWDVATGQLVGGPIDSLADSSPSAVAGARVGLITAADKWVYYWRFAPDQWPDIACRLAGRNLTRAEWTRFGPRDQPYRATCAQWPGDAA